MKHILPQLWPLGSIALVPELTITSLNNHFKGNLYLCFKFCTHQVLPFPNSAQLWLTNLFCKFCVQLNLFLALICDCCFVFCCFCLYVQCVKASHFGMVARHLPGLHLLHRILPILNFVALFKHKPSISVTLWQIFSKLYLCENIYSKSYLLFTNNKTKKCISLL